MEHSIPGMRMGYSVPALLKHDGNGKVKVISDPQEIERLRRECGYAPPVADTNYKLNSWGE